MRESRERKREGAMRGKERGSSERGGRAVRERVEREREEGEQ